MTPERKAELRTMRPASASGFVHYEAAIKPEVDAMLDEIDKLEQEVETQELYIDMLEKTMRHRMEVFDLKGGDT